MPRVTSCRTFSIERLERRYALTVFPFDGRIAIPSDQLRNPVNSLGALAATPAIGMVLQDRNHNGSLDSGEGFGTAFLIGPNLAMTAAHVVYGRDFQGRETLNASPSNMIVKFGWDGTSTNVAVAGVRRWQVPSNWANMVGTLYTGADGKMATRGESLPYDYALLTLDQNIGSIAKAWFFPSTRDISSYVADGDGNYTNTILVSGYPSDDRWAALHYPQVISGGPLASVHDTYLETSSRTYVHYNPTYVFDRQRSGESNAAYNNRIAPYRDTAGIDVYQGMSGGPVWMFENGGFGEGKYHFVGIVSRGGSTSNLFTRVTPTIVNNLNAWTGTSGNGTHFALSPSPGETDVPILTEYYSLQDLSTAVENALFRWIDSGQQSVTPGVPNEIGFHLRVMNRGLADSNAVRVRFYLSEDDQLDTSSDRYLTTWEGPGIASQKDAWLEGRITLPDGLDAHREYRIGWMLESNGDAYSQGIFQGSFLLNRPPTIAIDPNWLASPKDIYAGVRGPRIPFTINDPDDSVSQLSMEAVALWLDGAFGNNVLEYVHFVGSDGSWDMIIDAPPKNESVFFNIYLKDPWGASQVGEDAFVWFEIKPTLASYNPWTNYYNNKDVSGDGHITAIDALLVINSLNTMTDATLPGRPNFDDWLIDVNSDGFISPIDALLVINQLNEDANGEGEGESVSIMEEVYFGEVLQDIAVSQQLLRRRRETANARTSAN